MQAQGGGRSFSDINVTPLVDVMLVLMIIFMVTAPMIQHGVNVDLPAVAAPAMPADEDLMIVTATKAGEIFIGETKVPLAQLRTKLIGNRKLKQDREVFLHADHGLDYGFVVEVMAILKDAGVEKLGMVTDPVTRDQSSDSAK